MTTAESFAALKAVETEKNPFMLTAEEWHTFTEEQKKARYKQQSKWDEGHEARCMGVCLLLVSTGATNVPPQSPA